DLARPVHARVGLLLSGLVCRLVRGRFLRGVFALRRCSKGNGYCQCKKDSLHGYALQLAIRRVTAELVRAFNGPLSKVSRRVVMLVRTQLARACRKLYAIFSCT